MNGIYDVGVQYKNKEAAMMRAIEGHRCQNGQVELCDLFDDRAIRVALLMPSITCGDITCLVRAGKITSSTKLIMVDDVTGRNRLLKGRDPAEFGGIYDSTDWREKVMAILQRELSLAGEKMIPKRNLRFLDCDILNIELRDVLKSLGEPGVDFAFFDFCGANLPNGFHSFIYDRLDLFVNGCVVWVTKSVGAAVPQFSRRKDGRISALREIYNKRIVFEESKILDFEENLNSGGIEIDGEAGFMDSIKYSNFEIARCFCNTYTCRSCGIYLYKGDRRPAERKKPAANMALFVYKKMDSEWDQRRGRYLQSFLPNSGYRPVIGKQAKERCCFRLKRRCEVEQINGQEWYLTGHRGRKCLVCDGDIEFLIQYIYDHAEELSELLDLELLLKNMFRENLLDSGKNADNTSEHFFNDRSRFIERIQSAFRNRDHECFPEEVCQCIVNGRKVNGILRSSSLHYEMLRVLWDEVVMPKLAEKFVGTKELVVMEAYFAYPLRFKPDVNVELKYEGRWIDVVSSRNGQLMVNIVKDAYKTGKAALSDPEKRDAKKDDLRLF